MSISTKVAARISSQAKKYRKVLEAAKQRDIGETDTVTIITDFLADALGYDKYKEISSEHAIRGTYVDRLVTVDGKRRFLIEAKAIGVELKDSHVKQAIDYAANAGVPWVLLSNAAIWRLYNVKFGKPIDKTLVFEIDLLTCDCKSDDVICCFGSLSAEGYSKDALVELLAEKQSGSKYTIAAVLRAPKMLEALRKEVRRLTGIRLETDYLSELLENEIIKRELIDSDEAQGASAYVKKLQRASEKTRDEVAGAPEPASPTHTVAVNAPSS